MLEKQRVNELFQKYVISSEMPDEEMSELTLEELTLIYATAEAVKKDEKYKGINFAIRQSIVYWAAVKAIKEADCLFIAHTPQPNYPYLDARRNAWIFSTEEIAKKAADSMASNKNIILSIRKLDKKMILPMFAQLYFCGIDSVVVDNFAHPVIIKRTDILPEPQWNGGEKQQVYNGKLQSAMIQFFQYLHIKGDFPDKDKILKALEAQTLIQMVDARYLVPMVLVKDGVPVKPGIQMQNEEGVTRRIANIIDERDKSQWVPAFTDWAEFAKTYKPTEWGAIIVTYDALVKLSKDTIGKIIINPRGCGFRINEEVMARIAEFEKRKREIDEKMKNEGQSAAEQPSAAKPAAAAEKKAETPENGAEGLVYGDLVETPDLMITVLKKKAKALKNVKRMWLAQRVENGANGYLLVVEAVSGAEEVMKELKETAQPYLDGCIMECRIASPAALNIVKDIKPFYKKGIFG